MCSSSSKEFSIKAQFTGYITLLRRQYCIDPTNACDNEHLFQKGTGLYMGDSPPGQHFVDRSGKCGILRSLSEPSRTIYSGEKALWNKDDYVDFASANVAIDHSTWLLDYIQKNKTRDLTIFPSTSILNGIVRDFVSNHWAILTKRLIEDTAQVIGDFLHWVVIKRMEWESIRDIMTVANEALSRIA
jgi:hypothetical protein